MDLHRRAHSHDLPEPWASAPSDDDPDWEFHSAPEDEPADLIELYLAAANRSRGVVMAAGSLDQLSVEPGQREGKLSPCAGSCCT